MVATPAGDRWVLDGTIHARRIGAQTTACGLPVTDWPVLFSTAFTPLDRASCRACCHATVRARGPVPQEVRP